MCNKRSSVEGLSIDVEGKKTKHIRVDSCIRNLIMSLGSHGFLTVACCCGHGKYPLTIVCQVRDYPDKFFELISGKDINRKVRFYKKDKQGYYYIPEVVKHE